jgi:hypothetical protein
MIWTKTKPTTPGYYWLKMKEAACFSEQRPRVVAVFYRNWSAEDKDELWVLEGPEFEDGMSMDSASDLFDWSDQCINLPTVAVSCGCKALEGEACPSCG